MRKEDEYRARLRALEAWEPFLLEESGLPGPRANLELAQAVAAEGDRTLFDHLLTFSPERAPANSRVEFLPLCGVVGLGRLLAEGDVSLWPTLREYASDPRWRVREGVAMALQRLGAVNMDALLEEMERWAEGSPLEQRAAAAALCEPALLHNPQQVGRALRILDAITTSLADRADRKSEAFRVLRQGLGYCWSVAVAALPGAGKPLMEKWLASPDRDVAWIMRENLKKNRLERMDAEWVREWKRRAGV